MQTFLYVIFTTADITDLLHMWLTIAETTTAKAQSKPKSRHALASFIMTLIVNTSFRYLEIAPLNQLGIKRNQLGWWVGG